MFHVEHNLLRCVCYSVASVTTNFDALNQMTVFTYNANQQVTGIALPTGLVVTNIYNANYLLATNYAYSVTGSGTVYFGTNTYTYANDLVVLHTDARGLTTSNTWDYLQRLVRVGYPDGTFITNTYARLDLVETMDRLGFTNTFGYDSMRRLVARTNALGNPTFYNYCTCGALQSVQDALGNNTYYYYSNNGGLADQHGFMPMAIAWPTTTIFRDGGLMLWTAGARAPPIGSTIRVWSSRSATVYARCRRQLTIFWTGRLTA